MTARAKRDARGLRAERDARSAQCEAATRSRFSPKRVARKHDRDSRKLGAALPVCLRAVQLALATRLLKRLSASSNVAVLGPNEKRT